MRTIASAGQIDGIFQVTHCANRLPFVRLHRTDRTILMANAMPFIRISHTAHVARTLYKPIIVRCTMPSTTHNNETVRHVHENYFVDDGATASTATAIVSFSFNRSLIWTSAGCNLIELQIITGKCCFPSPNFGFGFETKQNTMAVDVWVSEADCLSMHIENTLIRRGAGRRRKPLVFDFNNEIVWEVVRSMHRQSNKF